MGGGSWSTSDYNKSSVSRKLSGISDFDYTDKTRNRPASQQKAHKLVNVYGVKYRESCDSAEHPNSKAVGVLFDVTGSQGHIPMILQQKMPQLFGLLLRKGYIADPQLLFGGIGDHTSDNVPL